MKIAIKIAILTILCGIIIYSAHQIYEIANARQEAEITYKEINQHVKVDPEINKTEDPTDKTIADEVLDKKDEEHAQAKRYLDVDFDALKAINSDLIGWLHLIDDDIINYPVVQGDDNSYYLNHLFDGTVNSHGTLFLDYRNDAENFNDNSIIYGHTMKSAKMFHALGNFKNQSYYEAHPYFFLELPNKEYKLEVFACYTTPAVSDAYTIDFNDTIGTIVDENGNEKIVYKYDNSIPTFDQWYNDVMFKNLIKTNVIVEEGDRIFTMSACDYSFKNARVVVHCKVVETSYSNVN